MMCTTVGRDGILLKEEHLLKQWSYKFFFQLSMWKQGFTVWQLQIFLLPDPQVTKEVVNG